ncbi:unnamed protein product [Ixodes hexagonus]
MADCAEHSDQIAQFCGVTGTDSARAKLYLESAAWNLQLALASFYEETDEAMERPGSREPSPVDLQAPARSSPTPDRPKAPPRSSRIAGLADLAKDEGNNEEEGQAFYAGGSEHSGQQVLGPGKKQKDNFVVDLFKAAKKHGAQVLDPATEPTEPRPSRNWFHGAGYRLGCTENDTEVVASGSPAAGAASPAPVVRVLKMWQDGFSMDDGPLQPYDDPGSREFLTAIRQGEIPRELLQQSRGAEVSLNMEDHRHEQFVAPRRGKVPFVGEGHRLGSVTPNLVRPSESVQQKTEQAAQQAVSVDESQPSTTVQIRLSDGSRLMARLNHSHTVGDIRKYIVAARPEYEASTFSLLMTFPNKELTDDNASLKDANLLNAVIVQRIK